MAYVKTVWEDNKTPLDAANLNKIEEGIENAMSLAETNEKDIGTLDGQVAAIEVGKQDTLTAGVGIEITTSNVVNVQETEMSAIHMPIGATAEADGIHTTKTLYANGWQTYLSQAFNDVTPIVAGEGIVFNKHGDKDQMQSEYFDVAVNKDAIPYFPALDKNKYSLLSWDKAKQDWLTVDFSTEPSALSVSRRTATGQIKCEAPTENKAAVNKVYADSHYALCKKAQSLGGTLNLTTSLDINSCATIEFVGRGFNAQGVGSFHIHAGNTYVLQITAADGEFWVGGTLHILQNADKAIAIGKYVDNNLDEHEIKVEIERPVGSRETVIEIAGGAGGPGDAGSVMITYSYPGASDSVNVVTSEME